MWRELGSRQERLGEERACLLLAHGAGAGMRHPFMEAIAQRQHFLPVAEVERRSADQDGGLAFIVWERRRKLRQEGV